MNAFFDNTCVEITTPRLVLRPWRQSDLRDLFEYAKVDGVGQMAGWPPHKNMQESQVVLSHWLKTKNQFAIYHKQNKKVIGSFGIEEYSNLPELDNLHGREIGFVLAKDYWGQGLMPEAVNAMVDYLFRVQHYDFILCAYFTRNEQSKRVQEKCGFQPYKKIVYQTKTGIKEDAIINILFNPKRTYISPEFSIEGKYYEK